MPGGSAPECAPLPRPSYLAICAHNAVARPERLPAGIAVFHALHFALDICNMPSPLFTGLPAMLQNLPFLEPRWGKKGWGLGWRAPAGSRRNAGLAEVGRGIFGREKRIRRLHRACGVVSIGHVEL